MHCGRKVRYEVINRRKLKDLEFVCVLNKQHALGASNYECVVLKWKFC